MNELLLFTETGKRAAKLNRNANASRVCLCWLPSTVQNDSLYSNDLIVMLVARADDAKEKGNHED